MARFLASGISWLAKAKNRNHLKVLSLSGRLVSKRKSSVCRGNMDISQTIAEGLSGETRKENGKIQSSVIDRITHDIVNQLCVICLGCCELRNSLGAKLDSDQLNEFKRIEGAVQDAAKKFKSLRRCYTHLPTCDDNNLSEPTLNRTKRADNFQMMLARSI
jgi:hypothetical protein